ncbi:unnamed protein product [Heterobilharzia americana]|nr:unnamed protein product [Heterobilharzia americana]
MTIECKRPSYSAVKAQLDAYRLANLVPSEVEITLPKVAEKSVGGAPTKESTKPSRIIAIFNLWYIQLSITLLLWLLAIKIEFGAVFFIIGALYWLWVWGTTKNPKSSVSNNPDEQIISAGFFFDSSPIPSRVVI